MCANDTRVPQWAIDQRRMRSAFAKWVFRARVRGHYLPWMGGHDEGTLMTYWPLYYLLSGDEAVADCLRETVLKFEDWQRQGAGPWPHRDSITFGPWPKRFWHGFAADGLEHDAHHAGESFKYWLSTLWLIDPANRRLNQPFLDFAEHLINKVPECPPWYDWEKHDFRGHPGTTRVGGDPGKHSMIPYATLSWLAYLMTGESAYHRLAVDYLDHQFVRCNDVEAAFSSKPWQSQPYVAGPHAEIGHAERNQAFLDFGGRVMAAMAEWTLARLANGGQCNPAAGEHPGMLMELLNLNFMRLAHTRRFCGDGAYSARLPAWLAQLPSGEPANTLAAVYVEDWWGFFIPSRTDGLTITPKLDAMPDAWYLGYLLTGEERMREKAFAEAAGIAVCANLFLRDGRTNGSWHYSAHHVMGNYVTSLLFGSLLGATGNLRCVTTALTMPQVLYWRDDGLIGKLGLPENVAAFVSADARRVELVQTEDRCDEIVVVPQPTVHQIMAAVDAGQRWYWSGPDYGVKVKLDGAGARAVVDLPEPRVEDAFEANKRAFRKGHIGP